jgi:uncharacterized hydrophobic protein (TIGR00271 family)
MVGLFTRNEIGRGSVAVTENDPERQGFEPGGARLARPTGFGLPPLAVLSAVRDGSEPSAVYWVMNALATIIACYGLLANSPAVVIGAMVVAMLLGPISGVALGLNESDAQLLKTGLRTLVGGIIWILAIAMVVGFIHRDVPLTGEILSRTDARLFDLIIALAGGAAGAIAVLSPKVGTAIVGVAVATALVPPLAVAGMLIARGEFALAGGALLLAFTNIVAIQLAFSAVFWVGGYRRLTSFGKFGFFAFVRRALPSLVLVVVLAAVFGFQLHRAIARSLFESKVHAVLLRHFEDVSGTHLIDVRFARGDDTTTIAAIVRGTMAPSAEAVGAAQRDLPPPPDGTKVALQVRFVEALIMTPQGRLFADGAADEDIGR